VFAPLEFNQGYRSATHLPRLLTDLSRDEWTFL